MPFIQQKPAYRGRGPGRDPPARGSWQGAGALAMGVRDCATRMQSGLGPCVPAGRKSRWLRCSRLLVGAVSLYSRPHLSHLWPQEQRLDWAGDSQPPATTLSGCTRLLILDSASLVTLAVFTSPRRAGTSFSSWGSVGHLGKGRGSGQSSHGECSPPLCGAGDSKHSKPQGPEVEALVTAP